MRRQIAFLVVLVFGYLLILGEGSTPAAASVGPDDTTTIETISNETLTNVTSEISDTTTSEATNSASSSSSSSLGPATTLHPPGVSLDPQNNETTDYNTTTTPDGPLHNETGSPPTSSSLNTDPKTEKRVDDGQQFDAASFVGGIILAVGVVALGFFLFKVYQSRKGPRAEYNNI